MIFKINVQNIEELKSYQKGILGVLRKVELTACDPSLKEDIKSVYKLLGHFIDLENRDLNT